MTLLSMELNYTKYHVEIFTSISFANFVHTNVQTKVSSRLN
jgi:hypothetical protein